MTSENTQIEFRKVRTTSQLISTTFEFIKQEFKMLMRIFVYIAAPMILLSLLIIIPVSLQMISTTFNQPSFLSSHALGNIGWNFLAAIIQGIGSLLFLVSVNEYIKLYAEGKKEISVKDVWAGAKKNFWMYLGAGILVSIITIIGMIFLFIPGIYLAVALSFIFIVITVENVGVGKAFSRSFEVVRSNWWSTFGFYIIIIIIEMLIAYTVSLPVFFLNMSIFSGYIATGVSSIPLWFYITIAIFSVLSTIINVFAALILYIAISCKYFSLIEKKEQVGLKMQIEKMGE